MKSGKYKGNPTDLYNLDTEDNETNAGTWDPAPRSEQVETWMWLLGLVAVLFITCIVMKLEFEMPVSEVFLVLFLAFFFSLLAIQATGATGELYHSVEWE
jgi:hypothetical protein